jgi:hypothetical protein
MSNDLVASPFGPRGTAVAESAGARQTQSRELAETQVKYLLAQRFPRDVVANTDKILNAFTRPTLAEQATYQYARGGQDISGPSIRAAEAMAQQWGNLDVGHRELSRGIGDDGVPYSEVEAYCVDLENRTGKRLQFICRHWRDTKQGGYKLKDDRDINELISNQAQRRVRQCILATIPGDVTEAAMKQVEITLRSKADCGPEAMANIIQAFQVFGVSKAQIEKRIQRRLDTIQPAQVVMLKRIYASLRDDMSAPADWFEPETAEGTDGNAAATVPTTGAAGLKGKLKERAKAKGADGQAAQAAVTPAAPATAHDAADAPKPDANTFIARLDEVDSVQVADAVLAEAKKAGLPADQLRLVVDAHRMATDSGG